MYNFKIFTILKDKAKLLNFLTATGAVTARQDGRNHNSADAIEDSVMFTATTTGTSTVP